MVGAAATAAATAVATGMDSPPPMSMVPTLTETDTAVGSVTVVEGVVALNCCVGESCIGKRLLIWLGVVRMTWLMTWELTVPKRTFNEGWMTAAGACMDTRDFCCLSITACISWAANSNNRR